jgi:hypothetical protein
MNPTLVACMQACFHPTVCRWLAENMGIEAFEGNPSYTITDLHQCGGLTYRLISYIRMGVTINTASLISCLGISCIWASYLQEFGIQTSLETESYLTILYHFIE